MELFTDVEEEEEGEEGTTDGSGPTHGEYNNVLYVTIVMVYTLKYMLVV